MEETTPEGKVRVAEAFKLEENHLEGARAIRDLLGTDPLTNPGLFGKFGINTNQFLFEYLPRLRAKMMEKGSKVLEGLGDDGLRFLLGESFGGAEHIPHSMSFFAEKERLSDMVEFARENNLAKLLLRYNEKGTKKFFLNSLWQELDDYKLHAPGGGIDTVAADSMQRYQEMVMGKYTDHAERAVKKFGRDFAVRWNAAQNKVRGKLGMEPIVLSPTAGEHLMDMLFTTNTLTTQSYRVWLTLRNMTQMYTTSGALLGNQWIEKATMELSKGTALEDYIEVLRKRGTITEAPPLLNEITKGESKIGGAVGSVTEVGMRPMKRSDDITRAISYRAAEMKWDHFFSRLQKIKGSDLEGTIGINFLHDEIGGMVKQEIAKGTPESLSFAKHLFADDMTRLTMFDYAKQNMAQIGHGWLGKLFGQYQVYPIYYASFLKHVATHGTLPQKVAILGRVALNATATAGALSLMGIDGKNMLPWVPAQMTGGPLFNLALQVMQASDTTSYRGRAARGELIGTLSHLIPGSYEYQMVSNALKYFEAGKPVLALWALTSAPIRQDLRVK
jgi:hypothetical protein